MEILIYLLLTLPTIYTYTQKLPILQNHIIFVPDIVDSYSISQQIYTQMHTETIIKTRPKQNMLLQPLKAVNQMKSIINKFGGVVDQAKNIFAKPFPVLVNLPVQQIQPIFAPMPIDISQNRYQNNNKINNGNTNNENTDINRQKQQGENSGKLAISKDILYGEEEIEWREDMKYGKVIRQDETISKLALTEYITQISNIQSIYQQDHTTTKTHPNKQSPQPQKPNPTKIPYKTPNMQINQQNNNQTNQSQLLKIIFTSLLICAILCVIFSTNTKQYNDIELMNANDEEEKQLK